MKPLYENKKYDLSHLNDEQLQTVLDWLKENDEDWEGTSFSEFKTNNHIYCLTYRKENKDWYFIKHRVNLTNALELFEEEPEIHRTVKLKWFTEDQLNELNYSCDKSDVYERADKLMQDGKQHGLKIVVTFEKL